MERKTYCWHCRIGELMWSNDFSFEDYGLEGEGIIAVLTCPQCGTIAEFYTSLSQENTYLN